MNSLKTTIAILLLTSLFGILMAGSWQDPINRGTFAEWDPTPDHDYAGFVKGYIGDPDPPMKLMYAFYVIGDPHIGDLVEPEEDYNKPSWSPALDTTWSAGCPYGHNLGDRWDNQNNKPAPPNGGPIGRPLSWAVQLINSHYNYGEGSGRFCVILGDISNRAERAELEHGRIKLDSLDCPWLPIRGNHDTYPEIEMTGEWSEQDLFFEDAFKSHFEKEASKAFPCWYKAPLPPRNPQSEPHWSNWGFTWGADRHLGLDWVKRSKGGIESTAKLYKNDDGGTWDFFQDQLAAWDDDTKTLFMFTHNPLSSTLAWPLRQFSPSERTDILTEVREHYPDRLNYCFGGHAHGKFKKDSVVVWDVGLDGLSAAIVRAHFFGGIYGDEREDGNWPNSGWWDKQYQIGLVEVYGHKKCDFSYTSSSPNSPFIDLGVPITFIDECESSDGVPPSSYYWTFGDGGWSTSSGPIHTYQNVVGKYYVQLKATFTSGETYETYTCKPLLIGFQYPQWHSIRFRKYTSASSLGTPLPSTGSSYYAVLRWGSEGYIGWKFKNYEAYRQILGGSTIKIPKPPKTNHSTLQAEVKDDGPFYSGQQVRFQILAKWQDHHYTELGESPKPIEDFWGRDTVVQVPGDPDPPPSCPELYTCIDYDFTLGEFEFVANNTVLAHSLTNPAMAKDLLLLDWPLYEYQGFAGITLIERNTETSMFDVIKLHAVDHPKGTAIATSADGNIYCYDGAMYPWYCMDAYENDYLDQVMPYTSIENNLKAVAGQEVFVKFDYPCWGSHLGLLLSTGIPAIEGAETAPAKDNQICAHQEDTSGNWIPIGQAYTRGDPSEGLIKADTGEAMLPSFKLQFAGEDTACINYITLVALVDSGWTDTTVSPTTALQWYPPGGPGGEWQSSDETAKLLSVDDSTCVLSPSEQLTVVFTGVRANPDTSMVRDYVLESYGVYFSEPIPPGSPGVEEKEPVFTYAFGVQQVRPFSRTATISYQVPRSTHVSLALYDVSGRLVKSFVDEEINRGEYTISWDGTDAKGAKVSSGAYFVRIKAGSFLETQKLVILE